MSLVFKSSEGCKNGLRQEETNNNLDDLPILEKSE